MQTLFTSLQRQDPGLREADAIIRKCVHCGFCNATCPTFDLLGDELDGPRGRIYLIKEMLEADAAPAPSTVQHLDRCLSCLSCMTTCPSGVDYMHLSDIARGHIEERHHRPPAERFLRYMLLNVLTRPRLLSALLPFLRIASAIGRPVLHGRLRAMTELVQHSPGTRGRLARSYPAPGQSRGTVALLPGCVQQSLGNEVNHATIRLLNRLGYAVQIATGIACCGALEQHLGEGERAMRRMRTNLANWQQVVNSTGAEALIVNASGCGTVLKDYGHLFREDLDLAHTARGMSGAVMDISEFLDRCDLSALPVRPGPRPAVAWQNPCSMLHGQKLSAEPVRLLRRLGFEVSAPEDQHLCCGSAGTYNLLQPELAGELGRRKAAALVDMRPDIIASSNLGCMLQLRQYVSRPVLHCVQLLDWASGGPSLHGWRAP